MLRILCRCLFPFWLHGYNFNFMFIYTSFQFWSHEYSFDVWLHVYMYTKWLISFWKHDYGFDFTLICLFRFQYEVSCLDFDCMSFHFILTHVSVLMLKYFDCITYRFYFSVQIPCLCIYSVSVIVAIQVLLEEVFVDNEFFSQRNESIWVAIGNA